MNGIIGLILTRTVAMAVARHALTTLGGVLLASGYVEADTWTTIQGGGVALAGVTWSIIQKRF
jgi:hypothetical protein